MSAHPSADDLVLHYYGESPRAAALDAHLEGCDECQQAWDELSRALAAVTDETVAGSPLPAFGAFEADRAWQRLAPRLEVERRRRARPRARFLVPLAMAASLIVAFSVGRRTAIPTSTPSPVAATQGPERVLLTAVGDHLERSEMLLVELSNASPDAAAEGAKRQQKAKELVDANRLYRQAVTRAGEPGMASVLEELERLLVEVAHQPSLTPTDVSDLKRRIEFLGLIFKVRILGSEVRQKQKEIAPVTVS
ncbi:MAG TPA: hypothetical protein VGL15_15300 [Vicinamibacteria bacterium]